MLIGYFNTLSSDFERLTTKNKGIENSSKIINKVGLICFYPVENRASPTFMKKRIMQWMKKCLKISQSKYFSGYNL